MSGAAVMVLTYSQLTDLVQLLVAGAVMGFFVNGMLGGYGALISERRSFSVVDIGTCSGRRLVILANAAPAREGEALIIADDPHRLSLPRFTHRTENGSQDFAEDALAALQAAAQGCGGIDVRCNELSLSHR
jgi:hypothetical protein